MTNEEPLDRPLSRITLHTSLYPVLHLLRKLTPKPLIAAYHFILAYVAAAAYGFPSRHLTVIGVTGTYGKSSVVMVLGSVLGHSGHRVGWISTATISDGRRVWLNDMKMTMPGRFFLQRFLRTLVRNGCTHAIIETSSQGIAQHRHRGIAYDIAVLTNLRPEHLEAHGGFEPYRAAKAALFTHTAAQRGKRRIAIVPAHLDRPAAFTDHPFARVVTFAADDVTRVALAPVLAAFPENAAAALVTCSALGIDRATAERAIASIRSLPGRLERIDCGQPFDVIVDYAFTPDALEAVYRALGPSSGRTIHVLGGAGGGRDRWKYPVTGRIAAQHASVVIVTNEDPYDDDPMAIIHAVADGAREARSNDPGEWITSAPRATMATSHQTTGVDVREILDRREALALAMHLARPGDRVIVTGKGCEQAIAGPRGTLTPWDDRIVLRELLSTHA